MHVSFWYKSYNPSHKDSILTARVSKKDHWDVGFQDGPCATGARKHKVGIKLAALYSLLQIAALHLQK